MPSTIERHEAAAADIARIRIRHGEREGDGDGGVDRIAACGEDLLRGVGAVAVRHGNRRCVEHGLRRRRFRERGGRRDEQRR